MQVPGVDVPVNLRERNFLPGQLLHIEYYLRFEKREAIPGAEGVFSFAGENGQKLFMPLKELLFLPKVKVISCNFVKRMRGIQIPHNSSLLIFCLNDSAAQTFNPEGVFVRRSRDRTTSRSEKRPVSQQ
ncbi:MAG: hypothetical protein CSA20_03495 [Deltaproteobacteria bacterium]|nr:MAG: hypothetical protein CSB23_02515 [Deltaproteobacteria bacterium]PIE73165.1 MAG: hypothetical protein CSA20_03495 [Deltaproteobacteria bacterium]